MQVSPGQSLASRPEANPTRQPGNGNAKLGETRKQAVRGSPEIGKVVVQRITAPNEAGRESRRHLTGGWQQS